MAKRKQSKNPSKGGIFKWLIFGLLVLGAVGVTMFYRWIYSSNINSEYASEFFYVNTGDTFESVLTALTNEKVLKNVESFKWVAEEKNYLNHVKAGRYKIERGLNNNELVNLLRSGEQEPTNVLIRSFRKRENLAGVLATKLEPDSADFANAFYSSEMASKYGFTQENFGVLFMPNTYSFYWNTQPAQFIERMAKEYKDFWNDSRKAKARKLGLSQSEVSTLASIVQNETYQNDEKPFVAGVYINRIKKGMPLQADPTLLFALNDFSIKRVLNIHKKVNSPYNTYKYKGLPPGPICIPDVSSIDAVLNFESHKYLYFCAKEDFSGYHNFAGNYTQHLVNARKYQNALNQRKIFK